MNKLRAFSLLEVLLSIGLMGGLIALSFPVLLSFEYRNDLIASRNYVASAIRIAQLNSQAVVQDTQWGVKVNPGLITVFSGPTFAGRNVAYDQTYPINTTIGISGVTEIVFNKLGGETSNTGTLNLSKEGNSFSLNINAKGNISY